MPGIYFCPAMRAIVQKFRNLNMYVGTARGKIIYCRNMEGVLLACPAIENVFLDPASVIILSLADQKFWRSGFIMCGGLQFN